MKVTNIKLFPVKGNKSVKANGFITLEDVIKVKCMVLDGKNGLFVTFPSEKYESNGETKYSQFVEITSKEARQEVNDAVLAVYRDTSGDQGSSKEPSVQEAPKASPAQTGRKNTIPF